MDGRLLPEMVSDELHFLRLVEADETKPAVGDTRIQILCNFEPKTPDYKSRWRTWEITARTFSVLRT
jgi:hypothetical protein